MISANSRAFATAAAVPFRSRRPARRLAWVPRGGPSGRWRGRCRGEVTLVPGVVLVPVVVVVVGGAVVVPRVLTRVVVVVVMVVVVVVAAGRRRTGRPSRRRALAPRFLLPTAGFDGTSRPSLSTRRPRWTLRRGCEAPSFSPPNPCRRYGGRVPLALAARCRGAPGSTTPRPSVLPFLRPTTSPYGSGPSRSDASPRAVEGGVPPSPVVRSAPSPRPRGRWNPPLYGRGRRRLAPHLRDELLEETAAASTPPEMDRCCARRRLLILRPERAAQRGVLGRDLHITHGLGRIVDVVAAPPRT